MKNPIRKYMEQKGLTPAKFAKEAGVAYSTVQCWLHGISKTISLEYLKRAEKVLEVPALQLYEEYKTWRENKNEEEEDNNE